MLGLPHNTFILFSSQSVDIKFGLKALLFNSFSIVPSPFSISQFPEKACFYRQYSGKNALEEDYLKIAEIKYDISIFLLIGSVSVPEHSRNKLRKPQKFSNDGVATGNNPQDCLATEVVLSQKVQHGEDDVLYSVPGQQECFTSFRAGVCKSLDETGSADRLAAPLKNLYPKRKV